MHHQDALIILKEPRQGLTRDLWTQSTHLSLLQRSLFDPPAFSLFGTRDATPALKEVAFCTQDKTSEAQEGRKKVGRIFELVPESITTLATNNNPPANLILIPTTPS